jgi:phytoene dehydrogenase-like protein
VSCAGRRWRVADLVAEWFETELLRGTIAAQGIFGTFLGPWSAGSSATLLLRGASDSNLAGPASYIAGGAGALTEAMAAAAQAAGAEIRTSCEVVRIKINDGAATGLVLANGDEIEARELSSPTPIPSGHARAWSSRSICSPASCKSCCTIA